LAEIREFPVNVAAIGISGARGDAADRGWGFLRQGLLKEPSKGLFVTNSSGARLSPPVCSVASSVFRSNLMAKLAVDLIEAFYPLIAQPAGEFSDARAIGFPQCRHQEPSYFP